jgi:small subunit ribosomal protein S1
MNDINKILEFIWDKGLIAILLIALLLIIHNPDRADKLKELFFLPVFHFFKRGSKQYMAAKVGYTATEFLKRHIRNEFKSMPDVKIKINWVKSPSDPVLSRDGTLVLRLRETDDQTRNVLVATKVALPHLVCPTLRPYIKQHASVAIDLAVLRKLADGLGKHAYPIFQRYFLSPAVDENGEIRSLFTKLVELDSSGTFVFVFLEELNALGETLYSTGETDDKTEEIMAFLEFLLKEARRGVSEEITLRFVSKEFNVGIILLAKTWKASSQGVAPYLRRMDENVKLGCDSIYVIAFPPAFEFFSRLVSSAEGDDRISLIKVSQVRAMPKEEYLTPNKKLALFHRNPMFSDASFQEKVKAAGLTEGSLIEGTVLDVSDTMALLDVQGINAVIHKRECSWFTVSRCSEFLAMNEKKQFIIKSIDVSRGMLELTNRLPELDPWKSQKLPRIGDVIEVTMAQCNGLSYFGRYAENIEIIVPRAELSWLETVAPEETSLLGTQKRVFIYEKDDEQHTLKGSIRQVEEDPWPKIHARLLMGTELRGIVLEVSPNFVRVELPGGLRGVIPRESMFQAGFEYADFEKTLVKGQGLDVVVTKVFVAKRRIRLDLKRNVTIIDSGGGDSGRKSR